VWFAKAEGEHLEPQRAPPSRGCGLSIKNMARWSNVNGKNLGVLHK
jgi:hypothetical protein